MISTKALGEGTKDASMKPLVKGQLAASYIIICFMFIGIYFFFSTLIPSYEQHSLSVVVK